MGTFKIRNGTSKQLSTLVNLTAVNNYFMKFRSLQMADRELHERVILWFFFCRKAKNKVNVGDNKSFSLLSWMNFSKLQIYLFAQAFLACINQPRLKDLWMHPRPASWFETITLSFDEKQWYDDF